MTTGHKLMVTSFLGGESNIGMAQIIALIYRHPQSWPVNANPESGLYFSPSVVAAPAGINREVAQQPQSHVVADLLCANGGWWLKWLNS
jgi:hypothetical protein